MTLVIESSVGVDVDLDRIDEAEQPALELSEDVQRP